MLNSEDYDTTIDILGSATILSPLTRSDKVIHARTFVDDTRRVAIELDPQRLSGFVAAGKEIPSFEMAGPRHEIFFEPERLNCALVTCGGLCPGLNDIIRSVVL